MFLWNDHKAYKMHKEEDFFFRGTFFYKDTIYETNNVQEIHNLLKKCNKNKIVKLVSNFNGNFLLGIKISDTWFVFQDKIASFPCFWLCDDDEVIISDSVNSIKSYVKIDIGFDKLGLLEVAALKYTCGNRTVWEGIQFLGAGEYLEVTADGNNILKRTYYVHSHIKCVKKDAAEYIVDLKAVVDNVFTRLIKRLNGRQAVLFLSGGYDSRLICQQLSVKGYKNVLCVSLRSSDDLDVKVGREIADYFGYRLVSVNYTSKMWSLKSNRPDFWKNINELSNGVNYPYYMQGLIIKDLVDQKIIDKDAVIMTGNSGDVVEGNDVFTVKSFSEKFSREQIKEKIISTHCENTYNNTNIKKEILFQLEHIFYDDKYNKDVFACDEAQDIYEYFNWYNRQCKYVTSDVRNYDEVSGNEWALPLWDDEFIYYWQRIPFELRYKRNLYYQYVNADKLPTANVDTLFLKMRRIFLKYFSSLWKYAYIAKIFIGLNGNNMLYCWGEYYDLKKNYNLLER